MNQEIREMLDRIEAARAAMPPEQRAELERLEYAAQRESWIRAMGPCEHGDLDWETCEQCREARDARRIEAQSDETPQAAQPERREPGPKDAPNG